MCMRILIYGAKSIALGVYRAMQILYPYHTVEGFLVSSLKGNSVSLVGRPVWTIEDFSSTLTMEEKSRVYILIATPENIHMEIVSIIKMYGFEKYACIDSAKETVLMSAYYEKEGLFPALRKLVCGPDAVKLEVYVAKFIKDQTLKEKADMPGWTIPIQVGADLTDVRVSDCLDNTGDNISSKNASYCELTALYWLWKNVLSKSDEACADYYGLFHYRRMLDISDEDNVRLKENDVDVILPFPMLHEPSAFEHHTRYIKDLDWDAMCKAVEELYPEYAARMETVFSRPYLYNYNMLIAKPEVLTEYCEWLFPILERVEELSEPKGWERSDRYIGYLGENLLTLYFMCNKDRYKIVHTGRRMLV